MRLKCVWNLAAKTKIVLHFTSERPFKDFYFYLAQLKPTQKHIKCSFVIKIIILEKNFPHNLLNKTQNLPQVNFPNRSLHAKIIFARCPIKCKRYSSHCYVDGTDSRVPLYEINKNIKLASRDMKMKFSSVRGNKKLRIHFYNAILNGFSWFWIIPARAIVAH